MATTSPEIASLDEIEYKSKFKIYFYILGCGFLFMMAFLNFYPVGDKLKGILRKQLSGTSCNPDYDELHFEWLLPKLVVTELVLPAGCFNRQGDPIRLSHVTINYNLINFSPFGLPFHVETSMKGQPLDLYFVQGIGKQMIRMKDQKITLARLEGLTGTFKLAGTVMTDLSLLMEGQKMSSVSFKLASEDFQIPSQSIEGLNLPTMKLNKFYIEAVGAGGSRVNVDKIIVGDTDSPIRANFKGKIDLRQGAIGFSPLDLRGEVAFSNAIKESLPLLDMMFQSFNQKDGFYQIRLGGMLAKPVPSAP